MKNSEMLMQVKFDVLEVYAAAACYYLALTTAWDAVQSWMERRMGRAYLPPSRSDAAIEINHSAMAREVTT